MQQEFIRGLHRLEARHCGSVATIGSFDGIHLGHRAILQQVTEKARELALPSVVMVFEPQPHEYFSPESAPARLTRLREKVKALFAAGIDRVLCLRFDQDLRSLSAEDFIDQVLVRGLGVRHLIVGDDFRFGCDRRGDYALLYNTGREKGFNVSDTATLARHGERISSTRIRQLLEQDRLALAEELLGRPFSISGRVVYGKQLGRNLGAPTANVGLGRYRSPVHGVYTVNVRINTGGFAESVFSGVANVGVRPTLGGGQKPLLEVHIFDFSENLYGQCIEVIFRQKLRREQAFESLEALMAQIQQDIAKGKEFFDLHDDNF
jgi:riboflavin kinase/FMN adenylyltransferase